MSLIDTSVLSSPRFLRQLLLLDAASCLATGALQLALSDRLAEWLRLPAPLLTETGVFLLAYAALAAWVGTRPRIGRGWVGLFAAGNAAWGLGCLGLLASGLLSPSALGTAWVLAQAAVVAVLAELQWMALRAGSRAAA